MESEIQEPRVQNAAGALATRFGGAEPIRLGRSAAEANRGRSSEARSQKPEARSQKPEARSQRAEGRGQRAEGGGRRAEGGARLTKGKGRPRPFVAFSGNGNMDGDVHAP